MVLLHHLENGVCHLPQDTSANYTYVDYLYDVMTTQVPVILPVDEDGRWAVHEDGRQAVFNAGGRAVDVGKRDVYDNWRTKANTRSNIGPQLFDTLPEDLSFSLEQFHYILGLIKEIYKPSTVNKVR